MAHTASTSPLAANPTLNRVWALIALMCGLLDKPARKAEFDRLCAETERLIARLFFECASRLAGRTDLLQTHEAYLVPGRSCYRIGIRPRAAVRRAHADHPHFAIIAARWRAQAVNRYRRGLARRSRFSRKLSKLHFRNQRHRHSALIARRTASAAAPAYTPARIAAPP